MKKIYLLSILFLSASIFAQVGIGTITPGSTLDVQGSVQTKLRRVVANSSILNDDQILLGVATSEITLTLPDLTNSGQGRKYTVKNINSSGGTNLKVVSTGNLINISVGGGSVNEVSIKPGESIEIVRIDNATGVLWHVINYKSGSETLGDNNIYTTDGTLTANRTVNLSNRTISFKGTSPELFSIERSSTSATTPSYVALKKNNSSDPAINGAVVSGMTLGSLSFSGNSGSGYVGDVLSGRTSITSTATENFTPTAGGSNLQLSTVPNGTIVKQVRMTITDQGNVGIGNQSPTTKLDINNGTVNGAIKIADGTQGENKVLTSDANGVGTWQNTSVTNITGTTPSSDFVFGAAADKYMGAQITLTEGKWFIFLGLLVNGATAANTRYAARFSLSSSQTTNVTTGFSFINNNRFILTQASNGSAGAMTYGMFANGIVRVDVTSPSLTLYLWDVNTRGFGTVNSTLLVTSNGENYLFAIKAS